jgi:RNA methyltransferase, TrmH family
LYFSRLKSVVLKQIQSPQNPLIKSLLLLQEKAKARKQSGTFLIEGQREITLALQGGYQLETVLFVPEMMAITSLQSQVPQSVAWIEISREVYQKLAYRDTTEGIIAVAKMQNHELETLILPQNPLLLVAEAIEKPGNLGALLRTADAVGADAVVIANPKTDLYNPNIVRSSVGCLFTNSIATGTSAEVISFLQQKNIAIYSATLQNANAYHENDYTGPTALVVGTEATGLTEAWREAATQNIIIPMSGTIDSMNVSVAAAILLFEAKRQRGFS